MYIKDAVKRILGRIRVMRFHLKAGQHVYIGYGCNIKGKIMLSSYVVIRPCVQIWCGGGSADRRGFRNWGEEQNFN